MTRTIALAAAAVCLFAAPIHAQEAAQPKQAISGNPILAVYEVFMLEYERAVTPGWTGVGGLGYWSFGDADDGGKLSVLTTDLKARFYPGGTPLEGFAIGGILGLSTLSYEDTVEGVDESQSGVALGVDLNWSWLLGDQKRWFVGTGIGAKRYFVDFEDEGVDFSLVLPTGRLNFGFAF